MTEAEWLASADPRLMLEWVTRDRSLINSASGRKVRLFAVACCRQVWHLLTDERSRMAVLAAERAADGHLTELGAAGVAAHRAWVEAEGDEGHVEAAYFAWQSTEDVAGLPGNFRSALIIMGRFDQSALAGLLREILGNIFQPVTLPYTFVGCDFCGNSGRIKSTKGDCTCPRCDGLGMYSIGCPWFTETVRAIARTTYADRDFARLPILADALEDAGAEDGPLLRHLRGFEVCRGCMLPDPSSAEYGGGNYWCPDCGGTEDGNPNAYWMPLRGPHVRGCWALDLILGKE